jgi:hypothetical protein
MLARRLMRLRKIVISGVWVILSHNSPGSGRILPTGCPCSSKWKTTSMPLTQFLHRMASIFTIHDPFTIF